MLLPFLSSEEKEGGIRSSPDRSITQVEREVGKKDEFTLVTRKERELVSIRDRGKSLEMTMPNSFSSLLELEEGEKLALSFVDGSPPPLQVNDSVIILSGLNSEGGLWECIFFMIPMISWCTSNVRGLND